MFQSNGIPDGFLMESSINVSDFSKKCRMCFLLLFLFIVCTESGPRALTNDPDRNSVRPITAYDSVFVEELTWMEVRDAMKAGKTTVIIPTGGVEQNGPYLITGKHNYVVRAISELIARKMGNALVAPVVPFVPEGSIDPPTSHMKYPGTISVTEDTFEKLLTDICGSFRTHGFTHIILIGDSGGNQPGMKAVAQRLNKSWQSKGTKVSYVREFYESEVDSWLAKQGIHQKDEGLHDDFVQSATLASIEPNLIRAKQRLAAGKFQINGLKLSPIENTAEWGKRIMEYRAEVTAKAIKQAR